MIKQLCILITDFLKKLFNYRGNYEDGLYDNEDCTDETELTRFIDDPDNVIHPYKDDNCVIFHNKLKYNKLPQTCYSSTSGSSDDDNLEVSTINPLPNDHTNISPDDGLPSDLLMSDNNFIVFDDDEGICNDINNDVNGEDNVSEASLDVFQDSLEI